MPTSSLFTVREMLEGARPSLFEVCRLRYHALRSKFIRDQPFNSHRRVLGTGIQVVTMREPTSLAGYAVTSYYIDGEYITTVGSAFVPDGRSQSNVTVFAKRDLAFGTHLLNITNMNGTRPSTFWLDYFIVDTSPSDIVVTSSSSSSFASPTAGMSTSASQSSLSKRIPAIAGAVAGALIVIVAVALGCLWRRRRVRVRKGDTQPFRFLQAYDV